VSSQIESGKAYLYSWTDSNGYGTHLTTLSQTAFFGGYSTFGVSIDIAMRSNGYVAVAVGNDWFHDSGAKGCVDMMVAYLHVGCGCWVSVLEQRLIPLNDVSSTIEGGFAGSNLELDDDALIIGIPYTTKNDYRQGSAAIYRGVDNSGGGLYTWTLEGHLFGPDGGNDAFAGWDVAIDDLAGIAVLGSPGDDYTGDNAGAAYVYRKSGNNWSYASTLVSLEPLPGDAAGVAVALDGTSLLAGAPGFDVTEEVGDRPHVLGFELVDRSSYQDNETGSLGDDNAWSSGLGGEGNGLFSLWIADPYVVPFDIPTWVGSLRVMLDEVTLDLESGVHAVTGDVVVAAPSSLRSSLLKLDAGTLLVGNSVLIGTEEDAGRLALSESGAIEVIEEFVLSDNASVSIAVDSPVTNARIDVVTSAPELAGAVWVSFGPSHDPELLSEGDRFVLISAGVTPTSGLFDAVILPGLSNGLAFEVQYGAPGRRSSGGCPAGQIEDCFGNCCPDTWLGDGLCDDGTYQSGGNDIYLNCMSLFCDKGDCTECWDDSSAWEMAIEVVSLAGLLDFGDPNSVAVEGDATGVEVVDLTGDFAEEICVTFAGAPGQLVIFENDGAGGVAQQIILATGDDPVDISSGDFDGDGNNDLAVANNLSQDVTLYYNDDNDPSNGFTEVDLNVDGPPMCLTGINANSDIYDDLVVGLDDIDGDGNGYWAIYLGDTALMPGGMGDGGGIDPSGIPLGADPANEEDQKDYVFAGRQSNGKTGVAKNVTVLLGGVTLELDEYTTGADPGGISTGDLDGDGQADLAVTSTTNDTVAILRQDTVTPGDFLPAIFCPVGNTPTRITAIDFDDDGNLDLATIVQVAGEPVVRILQGDGNLSFTSVDTAEGENVVLVDAGDVSGDGVNELVTVGGGPSLRSRGIAPMLSLREVDNASCPGDFDSTGDVGIDDLLALLGEFGSCTENCQGDMDGDNDVDIDDMLGLIGVWGPCPR
jgi:hypothetical protein